MEPVDPVYGSENYASGIMRIAHTKGNLDQAKTLQGGIVMCEKEPFRSYGLRSKNGNDGWYKRFHNYTLVWRPGQYEQFIK